MTPSHEHEIELAFRLHASALKRHALGLTRDVTTAEDIVQESFARLAAELRAGRRPNHSRAWLQRVAGNIVISRGRRQTVADRCLPRLVERATDVSPETVVVAAEASRALRAALDSLPETERQALLLAAHGYHGKEIATIIGRSAGATRTLLCRARARLRETLLLAEAA